MARMEFSRDKILYNLKFKCADMPENRSNMVIVHDNVHYLSKTLKLHDAGMAAPRYAHYSNLGSARRCLGLRGVHLRGLEKGLCIFVFGKGYPMLKWARLQPGLLGLL